MALVMPAEGAVASTDDGIFLLGRAFDLLGINETSVKNMPFEDLAMSMQSHAILQTTKALLNQLEKRLAASSSPVEDIDHLIKHLSVPTRKKAQSKTAKASATTSPAPSKTSRYLPKVVLSAYMIVAHPSDVLSGQEGEDETQLMESAAVLIKEFELLTKTILHGSSSGHQGPFGTQLLGFDKAWCAYLYRFVAWKAKDAMVLEQELVRAACKLELLMLQTCKVTEDGETPSYLTHDMEAIRQQVADDQKLLREKVQQLSGDAGIERMDSAISDARSKFLEAMKKKGSPVATPVANVSTPLSTDSSAATAKQPTENEQMVNEILHMVDSDFGSRSDGAETAEKDFEKKVREAMENAFWDMVTDSVAGDSSQLISLVKEVRDSLQELAPKQWKEEIVEKIDLDIMSQVLGSGSHDAHYLGQILEYSLDMVRKLSVAAKEDEMTKSHEKLLSELAASSEVTDNGVSSFVIAVIKGLRFILEEIKELQAEVSKARIQIAMQTIIKGSTGLEYLQMAFADRYGAPDKASTSIPLTLQWISTAKSVTEQEWSEHVASLSAVPSTAPALVQVLRAGHGASVGQASSSPAAAAGASGQPECKGERLDKLSTPESFQINLLRLRAVQDQFQQVVVISTSMLILRQVLMAESPKATTTLEIEKVISELFKSLVKALDGSPNAIMEQIREAMIAAASSASSVGGSPPSEDKVQARMQVINRVFLKSLEPGDAVFKMVSRAVDCAFRGAVLGGGGIKGQKLADAALRRVGAAKLLDRVVKAAEVVIKMATVSEKVHGPWYSALM